MTKANSKPHIANFRFYEELNDFLPPEKRKISFEYYFNNTPSIKDAIEANGIPHTEVDLIRVNGVSVTFDYLLKPQDNVSVYPKFESFDITSVSQLRETSLRQISFVLDVHLGKLAKLLRMCGFDCLYENNFADDKIIEFSIEENRVILTRDLGILKHKVVTHGYYVRQTDPHAQLSEIINRFDLRAEIKPFTRCLECNTHFKRIDKEQVIDRLDEETKRAFNDFVYCETCDKVYWQGSHYDKMLTVIENLLSGWKS